MITDFGLSKMLESDSQRQVVIKEGRVPIRWLAVETLTHGIYSSCTDVWSYGRKQTPITLGALFSPHFLKSFSLLIGVTLWEIFTFGDMPYGDMETLAVRDHVVAGGRLDQPAGVHNLVYLEMLKCE